MEDTEDMEAMKTRHRAEKKELRKQIQRMKGSAAKRDKKAVRQRCDELMAEMDAKHKEELREAGFDTDADGEGAGASSSEATATSNSSSSSSSEESNTTNNSSANEESQQDMMGGGLYANPKGGKKQSRAQKRRAKKAQEEKELMERVKQAEEEAGPDPGVVEMEQLEKQVREQGLKIRAVPADGNCMFAAVALQLDNDTKQKEVRRMVAEHLRDRESEYGSFLVDEATGDGLSGEQYQAYCDDMEQRPVWGGNVELMALSSLLQRRIIVHQANAEPLEFGDQYDREGAIQLSYHRQLIRSGEHYNSVVVNEEGSVEVEL